MLPGPTPVSSHSLRSRALRPGDPGRGGAGPSGGVWGEEPPCLRTMGSPRGPPCWVTRTDPCNREPGACWGGGDPAVSPGQGAGPGGGRQGPAALGPCCGHTQAAPAAPGRGALPLRGSAGLGAQQVLQEPLELRVPEGLQAAGRPERGVPERPLRCGWGQPVSGHTPEAGFNVGSGRRPDSAPALTGTAGWRETEADVTVTSQGPDPVVGLRVTRKGLGAQHLWRWGGHEGSPLSGRQARGSGCRQRC